MGDFKVSRKTGRNRQDHQFPNLPTSSAASFNEFSLLLSAAVSLQRLAVGKDMLLGLVLVAAMTCSWNGIIPNDQTVQGSGCQHVQLQPVATLQLLSQDATRFSIGMETTLPWKKGISWDAVSSHQTAGAHDIMTNRIASGNARGCELENG